MGWLNPTITFEDAQIKEFFDGLKDVPLLDKKINAVVIEANKTLADVRKITIEPDIKTHSQIGNTVTLSIAGQAEYTIYFKDGWKRSFWFLIPAKAEAK